LGNGQRGQQRRESQGEEGIGIGSDGNLEAKKVPTRRHKIVCGKIVRDKLLGMLQPPVDKTFLIHFPFANSWLHHLLFGISCHFWLTESLPFFSAKLKANSKRQMAEGQKIFCCRWHFPWPAKMVSHRRAFLLLIAAFAIASVLRGY
jgi:hypothetical protein